MELYETEEVTELQNIGEILFPLAINPRKLIITGTPGSGKSTLLKKLKGWPEEGCLDITIKDWWKAQLLHTKPRELHFSLPFLGHDESFPVYEVEKLEAVSHLELDVMRIMMPPVKRGLLSADWRGRFALEFQILPAHKLYEHRMQRAMQGTHHVDRGLTLERVEEEVKVYKSLALLFHRSGWFVYLREDYNGVPKRFCEPVMGETQFEELYADLVCKQAMSTHEDGLKLYH